MIVKAFIKAISYYLPEKVVSNKELSTRFPEWSTDKIALKLGINNRHIAAKDEFSSDMAVKAAEKLFDEHGISRYEIDFILFCTQSPDYFLPTTACIIQERLNIPKTTGALDFNLGCSGYVYGLAIAKGLIISGIAKTILFITSETYSKFISQEDKGNSTIFGDAASATIISLEGGFEIGEFSLGTDGKGAENLIVQNGGMRYPKQYPHLEKAVSSKATIQDGDHLFMNGPEIFNFTLERVPALVAETLNRNKLIHNDINHFIFHQANKYILNYIRKKIGIPEDRFEIFIENCGNTVSSTIPITLSELIKSGRLQNNSNILLAGFGVGYSWGGCVIKYFENNQCK